MAAQPMPFQVMTRQPPRLRFLPASITVALQVRHRDRQRVGGVGRGRDREAEDHANHLRNLLLFGPPVAGHRSLHQRGRVLVRVESGPSAHQKRHPARVSQLGGRRRVFRVKQRLDARDVRPVRLHHRHELALDDDEA